MTEETLIIAHVEPTRSGWKVYATHPGESMVYKREYYTDNQWIATLCDQAREHQCLIRVQVKPNTWFLPELTDQIEILGERRIGERRQQERRQETREARTPKGDAA